MRSAVGLLLGHDSLRAVELVFQGKRVRQRQDWSFSCGTPEDRQHGLTRIAEEATRDAHWVVGVPGDRVTHRYLSLPLRGREPLLRSVAYALEDHVPDDVEALSAAWVPLGQGSLSEGLAFAMPTSELRATLELLAAAGVDPQQVVPADLACWFVYGEVLGDAWLLDARASPALLAFRGGRPTARHVFGRALDDPDELRWAWLAIAREVGAEPQTVYLTGGGSAVERVLRELTASVEPLPRLPSGADYEPAAALASVVSAPAAARQLNLRSGNLAYRGTWQRQRRAALTLAALAVACTLGWVGELSLRYWQLKHAVESVRSETLALFREVLPGSRPVDMPLQMQQYLDQLRAKGGASTATATQLLRALLGALKQAPPGVKLTLDEVTFEPPRLLLSGSLGTRDGFERWRRGLETSGAYQAVTAASPPKGSGGQYPFSLTLQLRPGRGT